MQSNTWNVTPCNAMQLHVDDKQIGRSLRLSSLPPLVAAESAKRPTRLTQQPIDVHPTVLAPAANGHDRIDLRLLVTPTLHS